MKKDYKTLTKECRLFFPELNKIKDRITWDEKDSWVTEIKINYKGILKMVDIDVEISYGGRYGMICKNYFNKTFLTDDCNIFFELSEILIFLKENKCVIKYVDYNKLKKQQGQS